MREAGGRRGASSTPEGATTNDPATEVGRAPLTMGKSDGLVETLKMAVFTVK
jgi:hypothetical protein